MNSTLLIQVYSRKIGGKTFYYPENALAKIFTEDLLQQKTFTQSNIDSLKKMGYTIDITNEQKES